MIQVLREKVSGIVSWSIIIMIALSFAYIGGAKLSSRGSQGAAVTVDGTKISWGFVNQLYANTLKQYGLSELGKEEQQSLKSNIQMQLARELAIKNNLKKLGYKVTDEQVLEELMKNNEFILDGKFNTKKYEEFLQTINKNKQDFENFIRDQKLPMHLASGITNSNFVLDKELNFVREILKHKRDFGYSVVSARSFFKDIDVSDKAIEEHYQLHQHEYLAPERLKFSYVLLDLEAIADKVNYTDEDIASYYEAHTGYFAKPERLKLSHILVMDNSEDNSKNSNAKAKIEKIYGKLLAGENFGSIAKEYSEDVMSARENGSLGWIDRGMTVAEFEKAAFELQNPGDLSQIVRTEFGYHIILLHERQDRQTLPLSEVKSSVIKSLQKERAEENFSNLVERMSGYVTEGISLDRIGEELDLEVKSTDYVTRMDGSGLPGLLNNNIVLTSAFNEEVKNKSRNSELLQLDASRYLVLRVDDYKSEYIKSLESISNDIKDKIILEKAKDKAESLGNNLVKKLKSGSAPNALLKEYGFSWNTRKNTNRYADDINGEILREAFLVQRPNQGKANIKGFTMNNGDYAIVAVNKAENVESELDPTLQKSLLDKMFNTEYSLVKKYLVAKSKIKLNDLGS